MKKLVKEMITMVVLIVIATIGIFALLNIYEARVESINYGDRSIQLGK